MRAREFVAAEQHRDSLGKEQCCQQVAALPGAQLVHILIVAGTFGAVIPGVIIVVAVPVILAVRLVMLVVITDEVVERKSVVRSDEVDARVRTAAIVLIQLRTAG